MSSIMRQPVDRNAELEPTVAEDRRRPGRQDDISPELVAMLRGSYADTFDDPVDDQPDQLASARGIVIWTLVSAAMVIVLAVWLLSR
jgi:hypothetical protein